MNTPSNTRMPRTAVALLCLGMVISTLASARLDSHQAGGVMPGESEPASSDCEERDQSSHREAIVVEPDRSGGTPR
jgi:hypothetical protein